MNEYNEAISRLNAFERPPNIRYIKRIPFGEYPDHTSTHEYNKILAESRFSRLPKYSIPQRFYITDEDLGEEVYNFDLDKSFVNANGDRKSIAIRRIDFRNKDSGEIHSQISVCSTINPYSFQNIIGSVYETHDMLNKIFPYDRQTNFSLWFNNEEGKRINNTELIGFLDLELIIDNTNNLNLDIQ